MELSPDGSRIATRVTQDGEDRVVVLDAATGGVVTSADAAAVNPRRLRFVDEDNLILVAGGTRHTYYIRRGFYYSSAFALDLETSKVRKLLEDAPDLYPYQGGLGRIIGRDAATNTLYMPAHMGYEKPTYGLYAVTLGKRVVRRVAYGNQHTTDWILDARGRPLVREDFNDNDNLHQIWIVDEKGHNERLLYEQETELRSLVLRGLNRERDALVVLQNSQSAGGWSYYLMSLEDGSITGPMLAKEGAEIGGLIMDDNRVVHGVRYDGFTPTYAFFDAELSTRVAAIQQGLPNIAAWLVSWDENFDKLLFEVEGGPTSRVYLLYEKGNPAPRSMGAARPEILREHVVPVEITAYEARDGLPVPALVTVRADVRAKGNAPLIVLPHGGPESHDTYGFDWMAQYFGSRGYAVLQPQFRGSDGFGYAHHVAGEGEWGGMMQSDLDDGVRFLIDQGLADAGRVCIIGASYGGYAALAAGAFSPDMYKCVAAIAPVADIPLKMKTASQRRGSQDWTIDYWEEYYGSDTSDKDHLKAISPAYHAEDFQAPVLLLHGERDTVVNIAQSKAMERALKRAKKSVKFVRLKGEDHWLTQEKTRIEALRAVAAFIEKHL
jgi:dipeptidyl aminopeptidase/acylaminoacyl peptidase